MGMSDEVKQMQNFENAVAEVIDQYLKEGMEPDDVRTILESHAMSNLRQRRMEIEAAEGRS